MATELERLREENDLLRLRVEELEGILLRPVLPRSLKLTKRESEILAVLLARPLSSRSDLMTALYSLEAGDPPDDQIIAIFIVKLRKKLGRFGITIQTQWGQGWFLTNDDKAKVRALS